MLTIKSAENHAFMSDITTATTTADNRNAITFIPITHSQKLGTILITERYAKKRGNKRKWLLGFSRHVLAL